MILLEPAYKILHTTVKFKRRTISVTPFSGRVDSTRLVTTGSSIAVVGGPGRNAECPVQPER
jgi:hypothetical protein